MGKPRRWFSGPDLGEWKMLVAAGQSTGPFFLWPFWSSKSYHYDLYWRASLISWFVR